MLKYLTPVAILIFFTTCKKESNKTLNDNERARAVLNAVVDTMERHFVYRNSVEWPVFRQKVLSVIEGGRSGYESIVAGGIQTALTLLGDSHSSFTYFNGAEDWGQTNLDCSDKCGSHDSL